MTRTPVSIRLGLPGLTGLILFAAGLAACSQKEALDADVGLYSDEDPAPEREASPQSGEGSQPSGSVAAGGDSKNDDSRSDRWKDAEGGESNREVPSTTAGVASAEATPAPPPAAQLEALGYVTTGADSYDSFEEVDEAPLETVERGRNTRRQGLASGSGRVTAAEPGRAEEGRVGRPSKEEKRKRDSTSGPPKAGGSTATSGIIDSGDMDMGGADATVVAQLQTTSPKATPLDDRAAAMDPAPEAEPVPVTDTPVVLDVASNTERFTDYGVNPFTMVSQDDLSTFSIDVDTASYSIARRKLEEGRLPPEAAVRVEEFINYFDFSYAQPTGDMPFNVAMEAMPDPFRAGHHVLRVGVQGKDVSRDERPPVHLTFLVDVSGSMSSADKLPLAKKSMHMMVDSLREDDTVALAVYAGRTAKVLEPTSAADKRAIHDAIEDLKSGGSTAMSSGIDLAYGMAQESFQPGHENRVIVLSDGDANVGRTSWDEMLSQIKGHADRGVTLSTIGFGMGNYQDTLMEQLSNNGDGNNYYIDDAEQAQRVFVDELGGTLVTIARDVKIQVDFNDESVLAYRLLGYENRDVADVDFRNDKVDAGEIGAGHNVTALYEVILKDGYTRELATVRVRWEKPGADVDMGGSGGIERAYTFRDRDLKETPYLAGRDTRIAYASATFAEILRGSPHTQEIDLAALARFTTQSARKGEKDDLELIGLMKKADQLGADGAFLADN